MAAFTFNQANGTNLTTIDVKWTGNPTLFEVQSSILRITNVSTWNDRFAYYSNGQGGTQESEVTLMASPSFGGGEILEICTQLQSLSVLYSVRVDGTNLTLRRNGSFQSQAAHGMTMSASVNIVRITSNSSTGVVNAYANGSLITTFTDGTPLTGGFPGFYFNAQGTVSAIGITKWTDNVSSGVSGTLAKTNTNDTAAITGTTTVLGTLARTNANDGRTISGTTTIVGSVTRTNGNDTASIAGSVGSPVAGTLAKTDVADGMVGAGTTTILSTLARTNTNDTMVGAGSVTILGTLAQTNVNDTMVANGSSGTAVFGTLARTNTDDTTAATGTTTILGSLARTNANDVMVGAGTTTLLGILARTNRNDASAIFGISGTPSIALQIWNKLTIAKRNSL